MYGKHKLDRRKRTIQLKTTESNMFLSRVKSGQVHVVV